MSRERLEAIRLRNCGSENCWATEPRGKRLWCWIGLHKWVVNVIRTPDGPDHFHCWYCAAGADR